MFSFYNMALTAFDRCCIITTPGKEIVLNKRRKKFGELFKELHFTSLLGAVTYISLGYVVASFARTEDSANGLVSAIQFPLMFRSGTFFPIDVMPDALKSVARFLPLTYLSDAMRQVMVDGAAFAPLWVCVAVLAGWAVVCFGISARFFKWQ